MMIHRYVPPADPSRPVLLLLHGTGGNEDDLLPLGRTLAPGAGLLSPRGSVLEHGMPRFFKRLSEGVFDLEDLRERTEELGEFVISASAKYGFALSRILAVGYSNGANIAGSLLLSRPGLLAGAVLLRPMVPFEPSQKPDLAGTSVLIVGGRQDSTVPVARTTRLVELLKACHADVEVHWTPEGHGLTGEDVDVAGAWLGKLMGTATDAAPDLSET